MSYSAAYVSEEAKLALATSNQLQSNHRRVLKMYDCIPQTSIVSRGVCPEARGFSAFGDFAIDTLLPSLTSHAHPLHSGLLV